MDGEKIEKQMPSFADDIEISLRRKWCSEDRRGHGEPEYLEMTIRAWDGENIKVVQKIINIEDCRIGRDVRAIHRTFEELGYRLAGSLGTPRIREQVGYLFNLLVRGGLDDWPTRPNHEGHDHNKGER